VTSVGEEEEEKTNTIQSPFLCFSHLQKLKKKPKSLSCNCTFWFLSFTYFYYFKENS